MSKAQQDAWLRRDAEDTPARMRAEAKQAAVPGLKNCIREYDDSKRHPPDAALAR
jgi:hypothetical protein